MMRPGLGGRANSEFFGMHEVTADSVQSSAQPVDNGMMALPCGRIPTKGIGPLPTFV